MLGYKNLDELRTTIGPYVIRRTRDEVLLTFHMLYAELLARVDQRRARLTNPLQIRLLRHVVDQLCAAGTLPYYAALRGKPGFIALLRDTLEELKRARVFPIDLGGAVFGLGRKKARRR